MHACTCTNKHRCIRAFLPRYIIISVLYRLCWVLPKAEEEKEKGVDKRKVDVQAEYTSLKPSAKRNITRTQFKEI